MSENTGSAKAAEKENSTVTKGSQGRSKSTRKMTDPSLNMPELRELAELVIEHGFTDFEFENENIRIRLSKMQGQATHAPLPAQGSGVTALPATETTKPASEPAAESDADLLKISSPIVGTFYRSPGPDKEPYVKEGSQVTPESVVCIVEAMKLMNEIQAETTGEIVKVYVENGQPVEYGQPLFGVRK